jgi:hypothetical protein
LARDFADASSAVSAWMASPTHRENILSPKYKDIGISVVEGSLNGVDTTIIVQLFGTKLSGSPQVAPVAKTTSQQAFQSPAETKSPLPSIVPETNEYLAGRTQGEFQEVPGSFLVSPFLSTRSLSMIVVGILIAVFLLDAVLVSKRRIARISGRSFAHISFLGMVLAIIIILRSGQIL